MRLHRLKIHNYKSLRNIDFWPSEFSVFVGPNGSGKSNLTDSLHFLSEVYSQGLEIAIARKGGFENLAFRRERRTRGGVGFTVEIALAKSEVKRWLSGMVGTEPKSFPSRLTVRHTFNIRTHDRTIASRYSIADESLEIEAFTQESESEWRLNIDRNDLKEGRIDEEGVPRFLLSFLAPLLKQRTEHQAFLFESVARGLPQELMIRTEFPLRMLGQPLLRACSGIAVFQLVPDKCRLAGIPSPNPELSKYGDNLPALIHWLIAHRPEVWKRIESEMRDILPGLVSISVDYLPSKTLGIFFAEGNGRPWTVDEVSDGTLQSLSLLVAASDPRTAILVVEEPENSLHPWVLRSLVAYVKGLSREKTVILTTHSPFVIDMLSPGEVFVVSRKNGESHIDSLLQLCPNVKEEWADGTVKLSELFDSGLVANAVPGGSS